MNSYKVNRVTVAFVVIIVLSFSSVLLAQLPNPGMVIDGSTALVVTDPQNDFLSPDGVTWGVVGANVTENNTVANIESLFKAAKDLIAHQRDEPPAPIRPL